MQTTIETRGTANDTRRPARLAPNKLAHFSVKSYNWRPERLICSLSEIQNSDAISGSASSFNENKLKVQATGSSLAVQIKKPKPDFTTSVVWCGVAMLGMLPCWGCCHAGDVAMLGMLPCWGCCHVGDVAMLGMLPCWGCCHVQIHDAVW